MNFGGRRCCGIKKGKPPPTCFHGEISRAYQAGQPSTLSFENFSSWIELSCSTTDLSSTFLTGALMVLADSLYSYLYHNTEAPSLLWRGGSYATILGVHAICRAALLAFNRTEVHGLDRFLQLLTARADYKTRTKGLITVSNHISVLDDPLIWGVLPLSFA